jgi:hypothetical protein
VIGWWIVYVLIAVAAWPVLAFLLLRVGTVEMQYRQLGLAAGLALLWPLILAGAAGTRMTRSARRPVPDAAVSPATTNV